MKKQLVCRINYRSGYAEAGLFTRKKTYKGHAVNVIYLKMRNHDRKDSVSEWELTIDEATAIIHVLSWPLTKLLATDEMREIIHKHLNE